MSSFIYSRLIQKFLIVHEGEEITYLYNYLILGFGPGINRGINDTQL